MDGLDVRRLIADTGRELLEKGLVARTWGNISAKIDDTHFAISPSGLGYENMQAKDVPIYDFINGTYEGERKPSSEKKVHAVAYEIFDDVSFVVHTHQDYATAVSLAGIEKLKLSHEEEEILGKIEVAAYGLPGTDKLRDNVAAAMKKGAKIVLMAHHGAVILGSDKSDAIKKAELLEEVCKRIVGNCLAGDKAVEAKGSVSDEVFKKYKNAQLIVDENILFAAANGGIKAQLDDIAQMAGAKLIAVENNEDRIIKALSKQSSILIKDVGCIINTEDADDTKALELLAKKAALTYRYTRLLGVKTRLSMLDCIIMRSVYIRKYSKQKKG